MVGEILTLGSMAGGVGLWVAGRLRADQAEGARRKAKLDAQAEEERVRECGEVVLFFANNLGYLAREAVSRAELEQLIDSGISPGALAGHLWDRLDASDGIRLDSHPLGQSAIPVRLPRSYRERHVYVVGKSGSGKTTLLRNLILQDLEAREGLAVLAPEAEMLTEEVLPLIPKHRLDDVVYINPQDTTCPVPLNPLHLEAGEDLDLKVAETMAIFQRVFADETSGGAPRMETILRQSLYTLMQVPDSTLLDLERLLDRQDARFREWVLKRLPDEEARHFWQNVYTAYPKDAHLAVLNRMGRFLRPKVVRSLLCSPGSLNIRRCMDEGKVLLMAVSDGVLGEGNAQVLGQLLAAKIQLAALSRADSSKESRRPFTLYIDEFQSFCGTAATSYEKMLSRARKYGLQLVLAHQQTGQIPEHLMRDILGNVSTVVAFNVGASDAKRLGREMVGEIDGQPMPLDPKDLLSLRTGEAYCKIGRSVFFLAGDPPPQDGDAAVRDEVIHRSRGRYGVPIGSRSSRPMPAPDTTAPPLADLDPGEVFGL